MTFRAMILAGLLLVTGSTAFAADTAKVVGWRGDGTGHYPDATPPTVWSLKENGESKSILWSTKLPCYSWSMPIIVGDKIFTRSEPYDLICLNKNTGKILWIRSHPPFVAVTDEEKAANPAWKEVETLVAELQKVDDEFVAKGWTKDLYKQKYVLQHKINDLTAKADEKYKLPRDMYVESWCGYTGATPCADGQNVFICSGDGITASYDLDGNRKWALYESLAAGWGEHGNPGSPALSGDILLAPGHLATRDCRGLDKKTGTLLWRQTFNGKPADQLAVMPVTLGGVDYALAYGYFLRVSDGKLSSQYLMLDWPTPLFDLKENMFYFLRHGGMWIFNKMEALPNGEPKITNVTPKDKSGYQQLVLPPEPHADPHNSPIAHVASPILHDGLLYSVTVQGWFSVVDAKAYKILYQMKLPLDFKNPPHRKTYGMGLGASLTLAGKYLYVLDSAGCMLVLEPGREYKQIAKNNIDYTVPEGWEPKHWTGPHHEQTEASPVFDGNRLYIRGEQFLYCVGEK